MGYSTRSGPKDLYRKTYCRTCKKDTWFKQAKGTAEWMCEECEGELSDKERTGKDS